ncbi:MAG: hypoxanthine phosphoribosyltransferase [Chloroflexota bacterium]
MPPDIARIVIDEAEITNRVAELAGEISAYYGSRGPLLIGVLNGAVVFMADLVRHMPIPLSFEFMAVSSYGDSTQSSGVVRILKDLDSSIEGRDVLIVEDIVDSGLTLRYLVDLLQRRRPAEVRVVTLFRKDRPESQNAPVDWVGFEIPDAFVVGYGLDYAGRHRNLPYLAELKHDECG